MVGTAKDAAGVGIDLDVYDLRVIGVSDCDEGIELDSDRALQGGKHGICVGVF